MQTTTAAPKKKGSLRAVLLLAAVFLLGLMLGAGMVLAGFRQMARKAFMESPEANARVDRFLGGVEAHFSRRVGLTPEERVAVHEELAVTAREFEGDRRTFLDAVRSLTSDTIDRICSRLPPDKATRLRALAQEWLAPWGIRLEPRPG